jgi:endonuclease/exonuclease/phosphatase family metal-dependent hydrolase
MSGECDQRLRSVALVVLGDLNTEGTEEEHRGAETEEKTYKVQSSKLKVKSKCGWRFD